jgi:lipopolysaccharide/colanic/teichoic acid biosynthesis glycosyltransferase
LVAFVPQLAGALVAALVAWGHLSLTAGLAVGGGYLLAGFMSARAARWRWLLPLAGTLSAAVFPLIGTIASALALYAVGEPVDWPTLWVAAVESALIVFLGYRVLQTPFKIRVGVIGSPASANRLQGELDQSGGGDFEVAATITPDDWELDPAALAGPYLCALSAVGKAIDERDLELLVITQEFPRERVDEALFGEVIARPVDVMTLREFHEKRFGLVPLAEVDYAWFTSLAGRHHRPFARAGKRMIDLAVSLPLSIALAPVLGLLALLIRRDGGPALYRQQRVGRNGRMFTIMKLRTMTHDPDAHSTWTGADDDRITGLGRTLRRIHVDEAPQLWNVIRGEMSLVGPRPEQPEYVAELTERIPFYNQRHIVKPGVTGWAQVRAGYAGSWEGTVIKLSNYLYYINNHTLSLDLIIFIETLRAVVADRQYELEEPTRETILGAGSDRAVAGLTVDDDVERSP